MKHLAKIIFGCSMAIAGLLFVSCGSQEKVRERASFDNNWRFTLADSTLDASAPGFDDSGWRTLNVPHDWSIESDFSDSFPATVGGGALPGGLGWYRKTFTVRETDRDKIISIDFDGIYRNSTVWINGKKLGYRPYGFISFRYDLTPYLLYGDQKNVIAVKVDNSKQPNSRWYSGSGIFRNVWLVRTNKIHVDHWGTYITTPEVTAEKGTVNIDVTVRNAGKAVPVDVRTIIKDMDGKPICQAESKSTEAMKDSTIVTLKMEVKNPELWSTENPARYKAVTELRANGKLVDSYETLFGFRTFRFDVATGFYLNGKPLKVRGVCLHHDLGCLGSAINTRALERQLKIMKDMGVNAIRTSHNPPAPEMLDLCDSMGILVQDEAFDMWHKQKVQYDYSHDFDQWYEKDLSDQILRDRNHPSVFMWSIGNEVIEQNVDVDASSLSLEQANLILNATHHGSGAVSSDSAKNGEELITIALANVVKKLDKTRPVTAACNQAYTDNNLFRSGALDVLGFNYHETEWKDFPKNFPGKKLIISESTSALATRGAYEMPSDKVLVRPDRWDIPFTRPGNSCSAYDNCHVPWGTTQEGSWNLVKHLPFVSGMFIWTGFDYLGEPTPYGWPSRSSFFGIVDLAGFPKDVYYMYQSEWTNKTMLYLFPHWNWKKGETVDVWAYYNNADEAELFLNGKSLGKQHKTDSVFHVSWRVPFEPGTLKVVSLKNGQQVMSKEIHTAGAAAKVVMKPDRGSIHADGKDLSFVTVEIQDKDGNLVPDASQMIHFSVAGNGVIVGTDNGDPNNHVSLKKPDRNAFHGKALVVIQSNGDRGTVKVTAKTDGLPTQSTYIKMK
jgi:beta-galactosidase